MFDDAEHAESNSLVPRTLTTIAIHTTKIRAGESVKFVVKFTSWDTGAFELPLTFETVGTGKRHQLHVSGHCTLPSINADPRNVFMRRVKHRPEGGIPPVSKRFVVSRGQYEFGPLLTWKRAEKRQDLFRRRIQNPKKCPKFFTWTDVCKLSLFTIQMV